MGIQGHTVYTQPARTTTTNPAAMDIQGYYQCITRDLRSVQLGNPWVGVSIHTNTLSDLLVITYAQCGISYQHSASTILPCSIEHRALPCIPLHTTAACIHRVITYAQRGISLHEHLHTNPLTAIHHHTAKSNQQTRGWVKVLAPSLLHTGRTTHVELGGTSHPAVASKQCTPCCCQQQAACYSFGAFGLCSTSVLSGTTVGLQPTHVLVPPLRTVAYTR